MKNVLKRLRSTRLSVYLIAALLAVFTLGQVIPQRGLLGGEGVHAFKENSPGLYFLLDAVGFLEIYTSPLTIVLLALFFVNLFLVLESRFDMMLKRCRVPEAPSAPLEGVTRVALKEEMSSDRAVDRLRRALKGFRFIGDAERFVLYRNRFGPIGFFLFHVSFFLILLGGLALFYTRSEGKAFISESQWFGGTPEEFQTLRPPIVGVPPSVVFQVRDIVPTYQDGHPVGLTVDVEVPQPDNTLKEEHIEVNRPLHFSDGSSVLIKQIDIAPLIRLEDLSGQVVYEYASVSLRVLQGQMDGYVFPYSSYRVDLLFYPDYAEKDGLEYSKSLELNNPIFNVRFTNAGKVLYSGLMRPGESREFDGLRFSIEKIDYWGEFMIVKDKGKGLLWTGFIIGIIGLVWRFFFYRVEVRGTVSGDTLDLSYWSELPGRMNRERLASLAGRLEGSENTREDED